ncbi:MAG: TetR/AcrR family transcriptional regulator [Butyrivibrio sp.]|nr:TetR/AcrR family transcriptional regulator [Butyrivibrio sp.]
MSRKATITQEEIVGAAFKITRKEGFAAITSRRLAAVAGCSTQPIFRIYDNMDALRLDVFQKTASFYEAYYREFEKKHDTPFVDLGLAYIGFAQKNPWLFRLLFIDEGGENRGSMYDLVNGEDENVVREVERARNKGVENAEHLFMKMWIFIHGAGCMAVTGDYDLEEEDSVAMLESAYFSFGGN